jgi:hypothetical protein
MFDLYLAVRLDQAGKGDGRGQLAAMIEGLQATTARLAPGKITSNARELPVATPADIESRISGLPDGSFAITPATEPEAALQATISGGRAEIDYPFESSARNLVDPALFDAVSGLMCGFAERHGKSTMLGALTGLSVNTLPYRRARPLRTPRIVDRNGLVDVVDPRALKSAEDRAEGELLARGELPKGVIRKQCGTATVISWASGLTLTQPREIAEALSRRNLWLASHQVGTIPDGWSAEGDAQSDPIGAQPHPELTLYSPLLEVGYVAVHSTVPRPERAKALARAAAMFKARQADQSTPLVNVIIVAESREAAVRLKPEIEEAGLARIVYPDDEHFWDPFPDGDWA